MAPLHLVVLISLLTATSLLTHSSAGDVDSLAWPARATQPSTCDGLTNDCVEKEDTRRRLENDMRRKVKFISYAVLMRDLVPCSRRGNSYYNCIRSGQANPYHRGCSFITKCARDLY
ncbi:hypothetical protein J5N97_004792 [Dioscorea zingiberensis]|uniref:Uncharacterized protein n=1 Tax=Dioscorea zingiberensis TaxID=325984 RepID=A0A9D5D6W9_9LILI|nr:hypothetical protein J5N97_004792 [Dioscorea zingiberensis]